MTEPNQPANNPPETSIYRALPEGAGDRIGPYKLLQEIGEGGFGKVYMAEQQEPVRRKVALKIIKPGMDTKEVIARFESERQALALMDHPNIARVLDAGATNTGRPYFVMELVRGVPITEYCDKNSLTTYERLELFVTVCRAVQHAHQKGVIHRDLKPSNVMVTLHDGQPVAKVIDFGVAKATTQKLTERTMFTAYGQMIGTPAYMSPEQAEMSGLDIDTRSDIYSLGVVLYELLTGTTPFELKRLRDASYIEMQRIIREEEPPRPSTRISTLGDKQTVIASHRRTDPAKLRQALSGDLDLIVMKALEKERGRRYETPNSFAQDIERFLGHEAIHARPQSVIYRLRKFTERNKAAVATASAVAICLVLGTMVSTMLAIQAVRARDRAQVSLLEAQKAKLSEEGQRKLADERRAEAETARQSEAQQRLLAEQRGSEAEMARQAAEMARHAEAELRVAADQKRADMERQKTQIDGLNAQLTGVLADQRRTLYTAQLNQVHNAWETDNVARVVELLDAQRPKPGETDLRGFEWHYWNRLCNSDLQTVKLPFTLEGGTAFSMAGRTVEFSPDGSRIAALLRAPAQSRGVESIKVWELETGDEVLSLPLPAPSPPAATGAPASPGSAGQEFAVFWARWLLFIDSQHVGVVTPEPGRGRAPSESSELAVYEIATKKAVYALRVPTRCAFVTSNDGGKVAALVTDHQDADGNPRPAARIWDAKTGEVSAVVALSGGPWGGLALGGDGSQLATTTFGLSTTIASAQQASGGAAGQAAAVETASRENVVAIWDVATGARQAAITDILSWALEFSPDGKRIAIVGPEKKQLQQSTLIPTTSVALYDAASGTRLWSQSLDNPSTASLARPVFSRDGQWVGVLRHMVMAHERSLKLFQATTGIAAPSLQGHTASLFGAGFLADGRRLRTAAADGTVKTWEMPRPPAATPTATTVSFNVLHVFSPDGTKQASVPSRSSSTTLAMTDVRSDAPLWKEVLSGPIEQLAFSPDSAYVAASWSVPSGAASARGQICIWEVATGKQVRRHAKSTLARNLGLATAETIRLGPDFAFGPSGKEIALSIADVANDAARWRIQILDIATGGERVMGEPISGKPTRLEFSPDGKRILAEVSTVAPGPPNAQTSAKSNATTAQVSVKVLDAATGRVAWSLPTASRMVSFSRDGSRLCGSVTYSQVAIWNAATGEEEARIAASGVMRVVLSPDGRRVGVVAPPPTPTINPFERKRSTLVCVFDVESGTELYKLPGHSAGIDDIVFSSDGKRIATTAGTSSDTKLWDAETGQELLSLPGADRGLEFTSDGRQLIGFVSLFPFGSGTAALGPTRRIVIANASALPPETEARKLVEVLTSNLSQSLLTRREMREAIESDASLSAAAKARALVLVEGLKREFSLLNNAAWNTARLRDQPRREYDRALELAVEASELDPKSLLIWNTRGVAHYRVGQYAQARADFEQSMKLSSAARRLLSPEDLIFLTMTDQQLGNSKEAKDRLERYRSIIQRSGSTKLGEWRDYLAEAEELSGITKQPAASPQEFAGWGRTVDPAGDCRFAANGNSLVIDVPGTLHSLAPANRNFDAPRVLQEIEGDFTAQIRITCPIEPQSPLTDRTIAYFGAGFLIWESADHFLRVERNGYFLHPNYVAGTAPPQPKVPRKYSSNAPLVEYIQAGRDIMAGRNSFNAATPLLPGPDTWLRLVRRGQNIGIFLSHDGNAWEQVPPVDSKFPAKVSLGVVARNNSASEFHAQFSDLLLSRP